MEKLKKTNSWPLVRFIIPAIPEVNIFTRQSRKTTSLGLIMVATAAHKAWGWRVEVIDENNYNGPRDSQGLPDQERLQKEDPAAVVGFYCGLSSSIERVWELAEFYHSQGIINIAGGLHAHYCPEETLKKNIDFVVHGDGEIAIQQILFALGKGNDVRNIAGISFWESGQIKRNSPEILETDLNDLPFPEFGLLRYANLEIYPIGRIRGCRMNCEFCSVKGNPRWASAQYLFELVDWLAKTRGARNFFIVDDRLEEDIKGTIEFFQMIFEKYGNRLHFTTQVRLEAAKNTEFLKTMQKAGVGTVCIGCESPIDEELKAMHKGYLSADMLEWLKTYRKYFKVHMMLIFGYPLKGIEGLISAKERSECFKNFIRESRPDTIQILRPVPLVGTELRKRLEERIFPLELVPWPRYDGSYICFRPNNMTSREAQEIPLELMRRFYDPGSFFRIPIRAIAFPISSLLMRTKRWHRGWNNDITKFGGHLLIRSWRKGQKKSKFIENLEAYQLRK